MSKPILQVESLTKHYPVSVSPFYRGERPLIQAVDGISFTIASGETFGLIGESGCGKTTTVKMLLGLEAVTSGTILFDGVEVQNTRGSALKHYRSQVQAVFQDPYSSLNPRMRVAEIVAEPLIVSRTMSASDRRDRVAELLEIVGLPKDAATRFPHEFSGGQRQRVAIARSLSQQPRLLILDEPVSALDVSIRAQILNLLKSLQDRFGLSYLLISHDLDVVTHMCREIAVMYLGRFVETGPVREVRDEPQHPYSKALFSAALGLHPAATPKHIRLRGRPPSPAHPPSGCRFHTRCPIADVICSKMDPPLSLRGSKHYSACHFPALVSAI